MIECSIEHGNGKQQSLEVPIFDKASGLNPLD
jgi:hypothetical protein